MRLSSFLLAMVLTMSVALGQGWEWQNPRVCGNYLNRLGGAGGNTIWASSSSGDVLWSDNSGQSWTLRNSGGGPTEKVAFADALHGWGVNGQSLDSDDIFAPILYTSDGGVTWTVQHTLPRTRSARLTGIFFLDAQTGWVAGGQADTSYHSWGLILRTTDGGQTWLESRLDTIRPHDIFFLNAQEGWAEAAPHLLHTTDGGVTWTSICAALHANEGFKFLDRDHGWTVGGTDVYHSTDGGSNWIGQGLATDNDHYLTGMDCVSDQAVWVVTRGGRIHRTENGGVNWITVQLADTNLDLTAVHFVDATHGWVTGSAGVVFATTDAGAHWTYQNGNPATTNMLLSDVDFADDQNGWVVGYDGILRTVNGGSSWTMQDPGRSAVSVMAVDAQTAWTCGAGVCEFRRTTDGGTNWTTVQPTPEFCASRAAHFGADHLWAIGIGWTVDSTCCRSTDAGVTWACDSMPVEPSFLTGDLVFTDALNGWRCGGDKEGHYGYITHTSNGGRTWETQFGPSSSEVSRISFVDARHGWAGGIYGLLLKTTDGGAHWDTLESPQWGLNGLQFLDTLNGWMCSWYANTLRTRDGGYTWEQVPSGLTNTGGAIHFTDSDHGWLVGYMGSILRYTGTGSAGPREASHPVRTFALSAYPNPFNPTTQLSFDVPLSGRVTISIFDITGRLVRTLADHVYAEGRYRLAFDGSALASGIYFARLQGGTFSRTQKLVLLK